MARLPGLLAFVIEGAVDDGFGVKQVASTNAMPDQRSNSRNVSSFVSPSFLPARGSRHTPRP